MKTSTSLISKLVSLLSILLLAFVIYLVSNSKQDAQLYPTLDQIFSSIYLNVSSGKTILAFLSTILRVIIVLFVSFLSALLISFLYYYSRYTLDFIKPLLTIMKAAPLAAISVYIFMTVKGKLGTPLRPYLITYLVTLPITVEGFISAIDDISPSILCELRITQGPKYLKFNKIYFPLMRRHIILTLLQTIGLSFKVMIMAEYLCQTKNSVGIIIYDSFTILDMSNLIAVIIEVVIIVIIGEAIIKQLKKKLIND